jgi:outer membrane protein, heavy metal efflux system
MKNPLRIICLCALLTPVLSRAEFLLGANLPTLLNALAQQNAELAAQRQETQAAQQSAAAAGVLPDPSVRIEWQDISKSSPTLLPNRVGAVKYSVLQALPAWGKRDLQKQLAQGNAHLVQQRAVQTMTELRAQMKIAYAEAYRARQNLRLNDELQQLASTTARSLQSRYEQGLATQSDLIKAQLDSLALQTERATLDAEWTRTQARINVLLNRPADAPLADPVALRSLPALSESSLATRLPNAPLLMVQSAQSDIAHSNLQLTHKNTLPDFVVSLAPVQRGNGLSGWDAMLEFTVPLQREAHHAHQREAEAMWQASLEREKSTQSGLQADLHEQFSALQAAVTQEKTLQKNTLPLAQLLFDSTQASYQHGSADAAALLDAARWLVRARFEILNAQVAQQLRLAAIERLTGEQP